MKRFLCSMLTLILLLPAAGLGEQPAKIDMNISSMNAIMAFATVNSILGNPRGYVGRRVKVTGWYKESKNPATGAMDRFLTVVDMAACCFNDGSIFLQLLVEEGQEFSYPQEGQQCTVVGVIDAMGGGEETGVLRLESITALDHWQSEVYW